MNTAKITFATLTGLINQDIPLGLTPTSVESVSNIANMMFGAGLTELDEFKAFQVAATFDEETAKRTVRHFLVNKAAWSNASTSHHAAIALVNKSTTMLIDEIAEKLMLTARVISVDQEIRNQHRIIGELNEVILQLKRNDREPQSDTAHRATPVWPSETTEDRVQISLPPAGCVHQIVLPKGLSRQQTFSSSFCGELRLPLVESEEDTLQLSLANGSDEITIKAHPTDVHLKDKQWVLSKSTPFIEFENKSGRWLVVYQASI